MFVKFLDWNGLVIIYWKVINMLWDNGLFGEKKKM